MTRQTTEPFEHLSLVPTYRTMAGLLLMLDQGMLTLDPAYQRGDVWTEDQRVALMQSLIRGVPCGVVILSDRANPAWARAHGGEDVYREGGVIWACVDGRQRITTLEMWRADGFAVPASWLRADLVARTEDTADGPYVRASGLTTAGHRYLDRYCSLQVAESRECGTEADEAALYLLVNGGGTPQSDADMDHAARVAKVLRNDDASHVPGA